MKKDTALDYGANIFALWGLSTPNFFLGIMLILLISVYLGWLPASGFVSPSEDLGQNLRSMIMPAFVLGNNFAAVMMRHTRSAMLQVLSADYVRTARAKGAAGASVVLRHGLRNALLPIVTSLGLSVAALFTGAIVTEAIYAWPGLGRLAYEISECDWSSDVCSSDLEMSRISMMPRKKFGVDRPHSAKILAP